MCHCVYWGAAPSPAAAIGYYTRLARSISASACWRFPEIETSEARGVWGCAPVDRGGRLAADSPQEKLAFASFSCGDGRSRTAVRIKRQGAFYMLILPLLVGDRLPVGGPSVP